MRYEETYRGYEIVIVRAAGILFSTTITRVEDGEEIPAPRSYAWLAEAEIEAKDLIDQEEEAQPVIT